MVKKNTTNPAIWNCFMLSIAFLILYTALRSIQMYATSWKSNVGSTSWGVVYLVTAAVSPIVPYLVDKLNIKYSLVGSFLAVSNLILSYYIDIYIYIIFSSMLLGVFMSIKWTAQGSFLTMCCNVWEYQNGREFYSEIGWFKGCFYSFYAFHNATAALCSALYWNYAQTANNHHFFIICLVIATAAIVFILILRPLPDLDRVQNAQCPSYESGDINNFDIDKNDNPSESDPLLDNGNFGSFLIISKVRLFWALWWNSDFIYLIPFTVYYGFLLEFVFGEFTTLITDNTEKFYVMSCFGIAGMISTYVTGKLVDIYDATLKIIVVSSFMNLLIFGILIYNELHGFNDNILGISDFGIWIIIALLMGFFGLLLVLTLNVDLSSWFLRLAIE